MELSLTVKNLVIVGSFQPSKFDKYFFLKNNIFKEEEISETSIFSEQFCVVDARGFNLTIIPNQLIFTEKVPQLNDLLSEIFSKLVCFLDFSGIAFGINLHWYLFSEDKTNELTKKYFYNENASINKFFDGDNISYGCYLSKDFGNSRLKLDIKPATVSRIETNLEQRVISFAFNFHTDLKSKNCKEEILKSLSELGQYTDETKSIINLYA